MSRFLIFPFLRAFVKKTALLVPLCSVSAVFLLSSAAATLQQLQVGMEAPDFSLRQLSGEKKSFADLKGEKMTVLVIWSTWDSKSEKVLARMQKLYEAYGNHGLAVVAINADGQKISEDTMSQIRSTISRLKLTFPVLVDDGLVYFHDIGIIALPTTVIVDRNRIITYELPGYPLVGSEEMADFVAASLDGKKEVVAAKKGYQPNKSSLRLFNMGKNTLKSGSIADSSEMWFKKSIEADPKFVLPHISLGKLYLQRGDVAQAEAQFKEALTKEPTHVIALCETAIMKLNEGKMAEGQALLENALKSDESYSPCYYYAGFAYGKQGKLDQALKMFDEAARLNPLDYNLYLYKGRVLEEHKKQREAAEAFRKALEIALGIQ